MIFPKCALLRLQHDLIKTQANVVKPERSYVCNIIFADVGAKMLLIPDGQRIDFFARDHMEPLIIGKPSANPHPAFESIKFSHFLLPCLFTASVSAL